HEQRDPHASPFPGALRRANTMKTRMLCALVGLSPLALVSCGSSDRTDGTQLGTTAAALSTCSGEWEVVPSPNVGGEDNVLAAVSGAGPRNVWAVGQYAPDENPNMTLSLALHYDGSTWSVVETPNEGHLANALLAVTAQEGAAWAVGYHIGS